MRGRPIPQAEVDITMGVTETDSPDDQSPETDTSVLSVSGQNRDNSQRPTLALVLAASEAATGAAVGVTRQTRSICAFSSTMATYWNSPAGYKSTRFGEARYFEDLPAGLHPRSAGQQRKADRSREARCRARHTILDSDLR